MARNSEKHEKKRIIHCKTLIMARKLTNKEKEKLKW
jgi:hypothetical protein